MSLHLLKTAAISQILSLFILALILLPAGLGYGRPDGARERSHIPGAPEGARGPAETAGQSGRGQGAGLRLQSHHTDQTQD